MGMSINIDPGVKCAGVAVFEGGELATAWLSEGTDWMNTAWRIVQDLYGRYPYEILYESDLVVEVPQVYTQNKLKGDPNDLISVALVAGAIAGQMSQDQDRIITTYLPHQWKRQVPKDIMIKRIQGSLSGEERDRVELPKQKKLQHNVWDAIGIGLYHERRERRGRKGAESRQGNARARRKRR